jgi:hypothetical protein
MAIPALTMVRCDSERTAMESADLHEQRTPSWLRRVGRRRRWFLVGGGVAIMAALLAIYGVNFGLNAEEQRLVGVWICFDSTGDSVIHFRSDGTLRSLQGTEQSGSTFARWSLENDVFTIRDSSRSSFRNLISRCITFRKAKPDRYPFTWRDDGGFSLELPGGTNRVWMPGVGSVAEAIVEEP